MNWSKQKYKEFYSEFYPALYSFTCKFLGDNTIAKDIVQDAFIYLWERRSRIISIPSAKSYLYKYVQNRSLNYIRDNRLISNPGHEFMETEKHFQESVIETETYDLLYKEMRKLSSQEQKVIELSLNGKKNNEIANNLNITVNTVKTFKKRAFEKLRLKLKNIRFNR